MNTVSQRQGPLFLLIRVGGGGGVEKKSSKTNKTTKISIDDYRNVADTPIEPTQCTKKRKKEMPFAQQLYVSGSITRNKYKLHKNCVHFHFQKIIRGVFCRKPSIGRCLTCSVLPRTW